MYWCFNCEREFEELDIYTEYMGVEPYGGLVKFSKCPICGSEETDYALICPECGEYCGELFGDGKKKIMCDACIQKLATEENLFAYGYEDKQSVEINGYLAAMFEPDEIDRLLKTELDDRQKYGRCADKDKSRRDTYIADCKDNLAIYFTEMLQANK